MVFLFLQIRYLSTDCTSNHAITNKIFSLNNNFYHEISVVPQVLTVGERIKFEKSSQLSYYTLTRTHSVFTINARTQVSSIVYTFGIILNNFNLPPDGAVFTKNR